MAQTRRGLTAVGLAARITSDSAVGAACGRMLLNGIAGSGEFVRTDFLPASPSAAYTASIYLKKVAAIGTGRLEVWWYTAADGYIAGADVETALASGTHGWTRYAISGASPATAAKARLVVARTGRRPARTGTCTSTVCSSSGSRR